MYALISAHPSDPLTGLYAIAGRALLLRQLAWMRTIGVDKTVVAFRSRVPAKVRALLESDPLGQDAICVGNVATQKPHLILERAGLQCRGPVLTIGSSTLGDADLGESFLVDTIRDVVVTIAPPPELAGAASKAYVRLVRGCALPAFRMQISGWGVSLPSTRVAALVGEMVLSQAWPLAVHAHQRRPGIWIGRGARVSPRAKLVAPVYVGRNAVVESDTYLGPGTQLGPRSVVARGAQVSGCVVRSDTVVGEGVVLHGAEVSPRGASRFADGGPASLSAGALRRRSRPRLRPAIVLGLTIVGLLASLVI